MIAESLLVWSALNFRTAPMMHAVEAVSSEQFVMRAGGHPNSIAWLLWHIAEVEDNWVRDKLYGQEKRYPFSRSVKSVTAELYPTKAQLLAYFSEVRDLTRSRLESLSAADFDRRIDDEHYGKLSVRDMWAGIATSAAWHGGQIVFLHRLLTSPI